MMLLLAILVAIVIAAIVFVIGFIVGILYESDKPLSRCKTYEEYKREE